MLTLRRLLCSALICALSGLSPSPALAQEDGVTVDPGPADKEYAIPLDDARKRVAPSGRSGSAPASAREQESVEPPVFGAGVGDDASLPDEAGGEGTSASTADTARAGSGRKGEADRADRSSDPSPGRLPATDRSTARDRETVARLATNTGDTGSSLPTSMTIGAIAAGLLILGAAAGLALRRRSS